MAFVHLGDPQKPRFFGVADRRVVQRQTGRQSLLDPNGRQFVLFSGPRVDHARGPGLFVVRYVCRSL
jgi:hypothetical protein